MNILVFAAQGGQRSVQRRMRGRIVVVRDQMATLPDARAGWELLAMASTFAGNLTLLGSVANIIVAEKGRRSAGSASSST